MAQRATSQAGFIETTMSYDQRNGQVVHEYANSPEYSYHITAEHTKATAELLKANSETE